MSTKSLIPVMTGTRLGYEDYHGEFYDENNNFVADWNYDKRQQKYICGVPRPLGGKKRIYANSVKWLKYQVEQYLSTLNPTP